MPWIYLSLAAICEIVFAIGIKKSNAFTDPFGTMLTAIGVAGGLYFLALSLKDIPLGIAYPLWTALGSIGAVVASRFIFGDDISIYKMAAIAIILSAAVVLRALP